MLPAHQAVDGTGLSTGGIDTCNLAFSVSAGNVTIRAAKPDTPPATKVCHKGGDVRSVRSVMAGACCGALRFLYHTENG